MPKVWPWSLALRVGEGVRKQASDEGELNSAFSTEPTMFPAVPQFPANCSTFPVAPQYAYMQCYAQWAKQRVLPSYEASAAKWYYSYTILAFLSAGAVKKLRLKWPQQAGMSQYGLCACTATANNSTIIQYTLQSPIRMRTHRREFKEPLIPPPKPHTFPPPQHISVFNAVSDAATPPPPPSWKDTIAAIYRERVGVIRPNNFLLLVWNVFVAAVILFYVMEMGLLLAFGDAFWGDDQGTLLGVHVTMVLILVVDALLAPSKAFFREGLLVTDTKAILQRYLSFEGPADLLAILSVVIPLASGSLQSNWVKLVWVMKFYSVARINQQFERVTQLYISWNTGYLVIKLTVVGVIYAHYMGIGFYLVSLWVYEHNFYGPNTPNLCWIYNSWAFYQMTLLLTWSQAYLYVMYFSIGVVTTIAYGDITPKNPIQCCYIIFVLITITLILGYLMTEILRLLINVFSYNFDRKFRHFELLQKLRHEKVMQETQAQIRAHTDEIDREEQFRNRKVEEQVLSFLPPQPLYALLSTIYADFLKELGLHWQTQIISDPFRGIKFMQSRSLFLQAFLKDIRQQRQFVGDVIYREGETSGSRTNGHCAYYFTKDKYAGAVRLGMGQMPQLRGGRIQRMKQMNCHELASAGRIFGAVEMLNGQQRTHWALCLSNCVVFVAERQSLFRHYHLLTAQEREALQLRMETVIQQCLICQQKHPTLRCPFAFYAPENLIRQDTKALRRRRIISAARTRLKTLSSWTVFAKIRDQRVSISRSYKQKLLYDRATHGLFLQYQLQQDNPFQEQQPFETRLFEAEVMVEKVYGEAAEQVNACALQFQFDKVMNYRVYRPHNNMEQIKKDYNTRERRVAGIKHLVRANLLRLFA